MSVLWNIGAFLVAIAILVAVHEFGHFWVARRCGVKVHRFSLGFGPILMRRRDKLGTEFTLSAIPLGGYVKMLDGREETLTDSNRQYAFDQQPLPKRAAIVAAGPIANFIFAVFAYWLICIIGVTQLRPVVGDVAPNSIAAEAGLKPQMVFKAINGVAVNDWLDVMMHLSSALGDGSLTVDVINSEDDPQTPPQRLQFNLQSWHFDPSKDDVLETMGVKVYEPQALTVLSHVVPDSPADKAGLKVDDQIVKIGETEISSWDQISKLIKQSPGLPLRFVVLRQGDRITLSLTPESHTDKTGLVQGLAGISPKTDMSDKRYVIERRFDPITAIGKALVKTKDTFVLTIDVIKKLFSGAIGMNMLSGPISIAQGAGAMAQYGLVNFLMFLALISVNLGIMNLLPLPVLDGGHLLFFAIEGVTKRPISERIEAFAYKIGGIILFALMIVAVTNDIMRL